MTDSHEDLRIAIRALLASAGGWAEVYYAGPAIAERQVNAMPDADGSYSEAPVKYWPGDLVTYHPRHNNRRIPARARVTWVNPDATYTVEYTAESGTTHPAFGVPAGQLTPGHDAAIAYATAAAEHARDSLRPGHTAWCAGPSAHLLG